MAPCLHCGSNTIHLSVDRVKHLLSSHLNDEKNVSIDDILAEPINGDRPEFPPIGVFWDLRTCRVPYKKSALTVVQYLRDQFMNGSSEEEFVVVSDVTRVNAEVLKELEAAQIDIYYAPSNEQNCATDKLIKLVRRFAEDFGSESTILLITSDHALVEESKMLSKKKNLRFVLLLPPNANKNLMESCGTVYDFEDLTRDIPLRNQKPRLNNLDYDVLISNLPSHVEKCHIIRRLKMLSSNCGGRVVDVTCTYGVLRFANRDAAARACSNLSNEDIFGNTITAQVLSYDFDDLIPNNALQSSAVACPHHSSLREWEFDDDLLRVVMRLPDLISGINKLLHSHGGQLPLSSLRACYEAEVGELNVSPDGVLLTHMLTWVPGVVLEKNPTGGMILRRGKDIDKTLWTYIRSHPGETPEMAKVRTSFAREAFVLLLTSTNRKAARTRTQADQEKWSTLTTAHFLEKYLFRFGKMLLAMKYGYRTVGSLLESCNTVQVVGLEESKDTKINAVVVPSQPHQARRFAFNLIGALKSKPEGKATLEELPELLTKARKLNFDPSEFGLDECSDLERRPFNSMDYGLCDLDDLISCLPKKIVEIEHQGNQEVILSLLPGVMEDEFLL